MVDARIPFEMAHEQLLDAAQFKVLIFPNIAALSGKQCAQIRAFVAAGGGISVESYATLGFPPCVLTSPMRWY